MWEHKAGGWLAVTGCADTWDKFPAGSLVFCRRLGLLGEDPKPLLPAPTTVMASPFSYSPRFPGSAEQFTQALAQERAYQPPALKGPK